MNLRHDFFDKSSELLCVANFDGYFVEVNKGWEPLLGYTEQELTSRRFLEFVHPDDLDATLSEISSLDHGQQTQWFQNRYRCKDGEYKWLLWSASTVGEYIYAGARDITRFKEEELQRETLLRSVPIGIFQTDLEGQCIYVNQSWQNLTGLSLKEALGDGWIRALHPEDLKRVYHAWARFAKGETGFDLDYRFCHVVSGEASWVNGRAVNMYSTTGEQIGYLGTVLDVSHQKALKEEVESQRLQVIESSKLAAMGEMAGGVAHEVNNPLAIIRSAALSARKNLVVEDFEGTLQKLEMIDQTVRRIGKIVDGLRSLSRDGSEDALEYVRAGQIIEDALSVGRERLSSNGVHVEISGDLKARINCRAVQVSQVLMNLLHNAYDAVQVSPDKRILVEVRKSGRRVLISVSDTGPGVSDENLDKIFQPFFTTKRVGEGMGLGLGISKSIMESHGGELNYQRSPRMSTFSMIFK